MIQPEESKEAQQPHQVPSQTLITLQTANSVGLIYDLLLESNLPQTTKVNRDKALKRLRSLSQFAVQHARDISEIANSSTLPASDRVKPYATIYFKGHVTRSLKTAGDSISSSQLFELAEITMNLLVSPNVELKLKVHLQDALVAILNMDRKNKYNNVKIAEGLFENFLSGTLKIDLIVAGQAGLPQGCEPCGVVRLINSFLLEMPAGRSLTLLQTCMPLLLRFVGNDFFTPLYQSVQQMPPYQPERAAERASMIQNAESRLQFLSVWLQLILSLLKKYNKANCVDGLAYFASAQPLSVVLRSTLMLCANTTTMATVSRTVTTLVQHDESMLMPPVLGDTLKVKEQLNSVASKTLHFYKVVWQYLWQHKPADIFDGENAFVVDAHYFFRQLLDTLTYLHHVNDLECVLDKPEVRKMLIKALEVMSLFCTEPEFSSVFSDERQNIFLQVIVPFLKITETEKETMESDPKEFCHLIEDVCGDQKSRTVKTQTAKLLGRFCEKVPGFYQFMMTFCMDAITRALKDHVPTNLSFTANSPDDAMTDQLNPATLSMSGDQPLQKAPSNGNQNPEAAQSSVFSDPDLEQVILQYNLKFESPQELVEVCLVSLAATAYMLEKNRDMHSTFDTFMFENMAKILQDKSQDILVRQRASLLCSFSLDLLYQTFQSSEIRNNGLDLILQCLLDQICASKRSRVLAIQAIETLRTTVGDDAFGERIQINFDWVLEKLTSKTATLKLPDFFDFLVNFVLQFHNSFTESNLQSLLTAVVERIISEHQLLIEAKMPKKTLDLSKGKVSKTKKGTKGFQFRIAKCWSVLRYVAEHEHFVDRMVPVIEQCSLPLLAFMQNPNEIDFDDDLIFFISSLLKKAKSTDSAILQQAFQFLPLFLQKFNYIFGPILECISQYTMFSRVNSQGVDWLATQPSNLEILFNMAKSAMFPPIPQNSPIDSDNSASYAIEGCLVLQLMFQNFNGTGPLLDFLVAPTVGLVFDKFAEKKKLTQTLKRHLMLTLLSCSLQNAQLTMEAMTSRGGVEQLQAFFKELINESSDPLSQTSPFDHKQTSSCNHKKLKSAYELKLYSVALTNLVFHPTGNQQMDSAIPRAALLRQVVFALTRSQRAEQRTLAKASAQERKKDKKKSKTGGAPQMKSTVISQMVDNILAEGTEVGYSSGDDDADLSGDEVKTPIFVIKQGGRRDHQQQEESQMEEDKEVESDHGSENEELFVQEEYDLAQNIDQIVSRMDSFDEFKHFTEQAKAFHSQNVAAFQALTAEGLRTEKHREYFKAILQSHRVVLTDPDDSTDAGTGQAGGNVPRRIVKVKRTMMSQAPQQ